QLDEVEDLVNSMISRDLKGNIEELNIEEAKKKGAIAMFGEKYGDVVRVVEFGDVSMEFCGGTHVAHTGSIGSFFITKESSVSSGVRRIEAVVGLSAINYAKDNMKKLSIIEHELKSVDIISSIQKLKSQIKDLKGELQSTKNSIVSPLEEQNIDGVKVIVDIVENGDLKNIVDDMKTKNDKLAILLLQVNNEKVSIVAGSKNSNIKAGDWIKAVAPIVGGGGGGRADFAQAGGKEPSKVQEAKSKALEFLKNNI
ncbi:MAG: DHHA1 domain-containing protein, partial [Campylobacterota bacterium]|nr:DHHA1 domain-containing protein [Campylobacterota bacterium]